MKLTILCDVDGVICDFVGSYLRLATDATEAVRGEDERRVFTPADVTDFHFASLGLSAAEKEYITERIFAPGWVANLGGYLEGVQAVRALMVEHRVVFVTSPWPKHPTWASEREAWLEARFGGCTKLEIASTESKDLIRGDMLIDDKPSHVEAWGDANPMGVGVLWDAPYNQGDARAVRVDSWEGVHLLARCWGSSATAAIAV